MNAPLLIIAAGGTGGHMFPAQALAEEMLSRGWRVKLSTDERGLRYAGGFPEAVERRALSAATFARGGISGKLSAPFRIFKGVMEAGRWFAEDRPALVAGFGGYPALPALAGAMFHRIPRLIHEQNGVLGRVNRLFAARVDAVTCGVFPVTNAPAKARLIDMGNPIRAAVAEAAAAPYAPPGEGALNLLLFGGSQGATVFADHVPAAIAALPEDLKARLAITQQVRPEDEGRVAAAYAEAGLSPTLQTFFDDMPARIAAAHLVISRSGASTVSELTAIGRPAILAPYPAAMDDHQSANAAPLAAAGAAITAPDAGLTAEGLAGHIRAILTDPAKAAEMAEAARTLGRPNAGTDLADLVELLAKGT